MFNWGWFSTSFVEDKGNQESAQVKSKFITWNQIQPVTWLYTFSFCFFLSFLSCSSLNWNNKKIQNYLSTLIILLCSSLENSMLDTSIIIHMFMYSWARHALKYITTSRCVASGRSWGARDSPLVGLLLSKQPTIFRWRKRHDNILAVKAIVEKHTFLKFFFCKVFSSTALAFSSLVWWVASVTPPLKNPGYAFDKVRSISYVHLLPLWACCVKFKNEPVAPLWKRYRAPQLKSFPPYICCLHIVAKKR